MHINLVSFMLTFFFIKFYYHFVHASYLLVVLTVGTTVLLSVYLMVWVICFLLFIFSAVVNYMWLLHIRPINDVGDVFISKVITENLP